MDAAVALKIKPDLRADTDAIDNLLALTGSDLDRVNALVIDRMGSSVPMIPAIAKHIVQSGGKRLRPLMTLATARLFNYQGADHIKLAGAIEFIHTATLLHDDVVDESELRRGKASANILWGNQASVLVGDFLFSRAFNLMVEVGDHKVLEILSTASSVIAEGEVMQLASAANMGTTQETYLKIVAAKTAALFAAAARVGAIISSRPHTEEMALEIFGRNLGIAFQLVDDALDYSGSQSLLGKSVGDDFRDGKITLPVVLAYERASEDERVFWRRVMEDADQAEGDLPRAIALLDKHKTVRDTLAFAREYGEEARRALHELPNNIYRQALDDLVDFCIDRTF